MSEQYIEVRALGSMQILPLTHARYARDIRDLRPHVLLPGSHPDMPAFLDSEVMTCRTELLRRLALSTLEKEIGYGYPGKSTSKIEVFALQSLHRRQPDDLSQDFFAIARGLHKIGEGKQMVRQMPLFEFTKQVRGGSVDLLYPEAVIAFQKLAADRNVWELRRWLALGPENRSPDDLAEIYAKLDPRLVPVAKLKKESSRHNI